MDTIVGIFRDSKHAGEAVSELNNKGYTNDVTVIAKEGEEVTTHDVKKDISDGTTTGAVAGAAVGGIAALLSGVSSFVLPGLGLLVLGPLAGFLTGLGAGAVTGGLVGALVDWGIPEETAKAYEERLNEGEVLVGVTTNNTDAARQILESHGVDETQTYRTK
jgi:uncharacterized membrane protein